MDSRCLPLTNNHIDLYKVIHRRYLRELGKFPNIIKCRDYNDKIQWLKLFDQDWSIVSCTDKLSVRDYVKNRVGAEYLIDVYEVREKFSEIDFDALPSSFVIKTNHDCGTSILVRDKADFDRVAAESHFDQVLNRVYGRGMGEWSYAYIRPRIFVEEFLGPEATSPPADYQFHCVDGAVRFLQYIYERGTNTKEVIVDSNGCETTMRLYLHMEKGYRYEKPANWSDCPQGRRVGDDQGVQTSAEQQQSGQKQAASPLPRRRRAQRECGQSQQGQCMDQVVPHAHIKLIQPAGDQFGAVTTVFQETIQTMSP